MRQNKSLDFELTELTAITPLDGRYRSQTKDLSYYVSEYALIRTRFELEAKYLVALSDVGVVRKLSSKERKRLLNLADEINLSVAARVKEIESTVRHDVKSMERVFRELLVGSSLEDCIEMLHFGLTSEDINNLSYRLLLKRASESVCIPILEKIVSDLCTWALAYKSLPMLGRTHGQPAVPTTLGKEFAVFAKRLDQEIRQLKQHILTGKITGATGNLSALYCVYPATDWISFSKKFVTSLGFKPNLMTTQINPYEDVISYFQTYLRINGILIDLDQDMWRYISDNWLVQVAKKGEVGSSTMPQKINPEDFEKSEGNLMLANALLEGMGRKLSISRLQRDLSDSTVIRNIGTVLGYNMFAFKSTLKGLSRIKPNKQKIQEELENEWTILGEGVQTILRKEKVPDPYSLVSSLTRGKHIGKKEWLAWIDQLPIDAKVKKALTVLEPTTYVGLAEKLTEQAIQEIKKK